MRNNIRTTKLITVILIFVSACFHFTFQQVPQQPSSNTVPSQEQKSIQFKDDKSSSPQIHFKEIHYSYNPEIQDQYSIVNTVIYPQVSGGGKFVSSLPKDNFVTKLTNKNQPTPSQNLNKKDPSSSEGKEKSDQQKQVETRAEDILKKQTIEQEAKLAEQKRLEQKTTKDSKQPTPSIPVKPNQNKPQPEIFNPELKQKGQQQEKSEKKLQIKQKQKLITSIESKELPEIQKTETKIKFKQHQIAKPLSITNYPFETKGETKQTTQKSQQETQNPPKQEKPQQSKIQTSSKPDQKKPLNPEKTSENKQPKKDIIAEDKQKQQLIPKPVSPQSLPKQKSSQSNLDPQMIAQFNKITKSLQMDPSQIKTSLRFESLVKEQIQQSDWKLLIAKIVIWTTILIAIYQATCSSESQEKRIEKGKYSPVGLSELQTQNSLEMAERADQR